MIISELLEGEISFEYTIESVLQKNENLEIIVFLEKENTELKSFLFSKGISKIYLNNQIDIDTFIINLEDNVESKTQELNEEIRKLKEIIKNQEKISQKNEEINGEIITVFGAYGAGKSLISCLLCKEFSKKKNKTIIIDFDIYNSSINVMYNVIKYKKNNNIFSIKENIIKISKYEYLLCATDLIFNNENQIDYISLEGMFKELKQEYEKIIVDITSNLNYKYLRSILNLSNKIIYNVVPTMSEIKKALHLYEIITIDFEINREKIILLINKETKNSIDELIIAKIFNISKISGKIKYSENLEKSIQKGGKKQNIKIEKII